MHERVVILDFGSQYTQLIARRVREQQVFCEIHPFNKAPELSPEVKGIILSGSPASVHEADAPQPPKAYLESGLPILAVCYGAQWFAKTHGGRVEPSEVREYGRARLELTEAQSSLFDGIPSASQVWMSHSDTIAALPEDATLLAKTPSIPVAAFRLNNTDIYGLQFHPEVTHSEHGAQMLSNFLRKVCGCAGDWTAGAFVEEASERIRKQVSGGGSIVLGLSGGVDSSVAALLLHKAVGDKLHCIFVDSGLMREGEAEEVVESYRGMGLNVHAVFASEQFLSQLNGVSDPEQKRKVIGRVFIETFEREADKIEDIRFLAQGTIYPDVVESAHVKGPAATIKSHHNVGGLPDHLKLELVEPLRELFKDEVRKVGATLGLPGHILNRHPFPGPGLAIRILGEITPERVAILQKADKIFTDALKSHKLYEHVWQAGAIFLPVQSVGVMGDERTYEYTICLRAVTSIDGMTADWAQLPHGFLAEVSNDIINRVKGVNRVVYDISSKPPATIEWE